MVNFLVSKPLPADAVFTEAHRGTASRNGILFQHAVLGEVVIMSHSDDLNRRSSARSDLLSRLTAIVLALFLLAFFGVTLNNTVAIPAVLTEKDCGILRFRHTTTFLSPSVTVFTDG